MMDRLHSGVGLLLPTTIEGGLGSCVSGTRLHYLAVGGCRSRLSKLGLDLHNKPA